MPPPTALDKWLKKATSDDTGLTRPPVTMRVSAHKDEVRSIVHGYFQSQFRVSVYEVVGRSRQDSIQRRERGRGRGEGRCRGRRGGGGGGGGGVGRGGGGGGRS